MGITFPTSRPSIARPAPNPVPLLVAVGEKSFFNSYLTTFAEGYRAKGMIRVEGARIPDASHFAMADNPDAVAELIEGMPGVAGDDQRPSQETSESKVTEKTMNDVMHEEPGAPKVVDRATFQAEIDALRLREKAHTREGDAIAAARRRLPMVEVNATTPLVGEHGETTLLHAFEGRRILIAYFHMWHAGKAAPEQCEGCTFFTTQVRELSAFHARDVTYATFCQGPYEKSAGYAGFMGYAMPFYSARDSLDTLLAGRQANRMYLICYLRQGLKVFETYWTTSRGVEAMDNNYRLLDLTVYGRQELWEESPVGWPQHGEGWEMRTNGRPTSQWSRLKAGRSEYLRAGGT